MKYEIVTRAGRFAIVRTWITTPGDACGYDAATAGTNNERAFTLYRDNETRTAVDAAFEDSTKYKTYADAQKVLPNAAISTLALKTRTYATGIHGVTGRATETGWLKAGTLVRDLRDTGAVHPLDGKPWYRFDASTDGGVSWFTQEVCGKPKTV